MKNKIDEIEKWYLSKEITDMDRWKIVYGGFFVTYFFIVSFIASLCHAGLIEENTYLIVSCIVMFILTVYFTKLDIKIKKYQEKMKEEQQNKKKSSNNNQEVIP